MFSYKNESYKKLASDCNDYINRHYNIEGGDNYIVRVSQDGDFKNINDIVCAAWQAFYHLFTQDSGKLDDYTRFNRELLDNDTAFSAEKFESNEIKVLFDILRVVYEYYFWRDENNSLPVCIQPIALEKLDRYCYEIKNDYYGRFIWIEKTMPAQLYRWFVKTAEFDNLNGILSKLDNFGMEVDDKIKKFKSEIDNSEKPIGTIFENIETAKKDISTIEKKLLGYKSEYNFVLLSDAFVKIKNHKTSERTWAHVRTWFFLLLLLAVPIVVFCYHKPVTGFTWNDVFIYAPAITLEILFFYFMRLFYSELRSIRAQLLQIELRLSLCEFIHDYVDKRVENKDAEEAWKSFETLIFSPIQTSGDNIPSLLDGANAIAELAGNIMNPKGRKP